MTLAQEVFIRPSTRCPGFKSRVRIRDRLYRIAVRTMPRTSEEDTGGRQNELSIQDAGEPALADPQASPEDNRIEDGRRNVVREALTRLPEKYTGSS